MATQLTTITTAPAAAAAATARKPQHNSAEEEGLLPAENPVEDLRQAAASPRAGPATSVIDAAQPSALAYLWTNHRSMVLVFLASTLCFFLFMSSTHPFRSSSAASTLELAEWKAYRARQQIADKEREAEVDREQALKELMQQEKEGRLAPADAAFPDKDGQHYARLYAKAVAAHADARKRRHAAQHQSRDPHVHVHETEEHDPAESDEADDRALRKRPTNPGAKEKMVQIVFPKEDDEPGAGGAIVDASPATIVPTLEDESGEVVLVSPASKLKPGLTRANTAQSPLSGGQVDAAEVSSLPTKRAPMIRPPPSVVTSPAAAAGSAKRPLTPAAAGSNIVQQARRDRSQPPKPAQPATKPTRTTVPAATANAGRPTPSASLKPPAAAPAAAPAASKALAAPATKPSPVHAVDESKPTPHLVRAKPTGPKLPQTRENALASLPSVIRQKMKPPPPPSKPEMPRKKPL